MTDGLLEFTQPEGDSISKRLMAVKFSQANRTLKIITGEFQVNDIDDDCKGKLHPNHTADDGQLNRQANYGQDYRGESYRKITVRLIEGII